MTLPILNAAKNIFFLVTGASKASVLPLTAGLSQDEFVAEGDKALPAARIRPHNGRVVWFVDKDAASKL
jgi:6-phosphogluconolactonase